MTRIKKTSTLSVGIDVYTIENDTLKMTVTNLGCRILSLQTPDAKGQMADVLLGLYDLSEYAGDTACFGATIGRVAGRINNANFILNDKTYHLSPNNGVNHLHGGFFGFHKRLFDAGIIEDGIRFHFLSEDGEAGYPGNLDVTITYTLRGSSLVIDYSATTDEDTLFNPTNHMYFDLSGAGTGILDHTLRIDADYFGAVDEVSAPLGAMIDVTGTPFDFRTPRTIGDVINEDDIQLKNAKGYDHPFLLSSTSNQVSLSHPGSGRTLTISTTAPAVVVYSGNYLSTCPRGKSGDVYADYAGIALETQALPNAINTKDRDSVILRAGETFKSTTRYTFTT